MSTIRASILLVLLLSVPGFAATGKTMKADLTYLLGQGVASANRTWPDSVLYRFLNMAQDIVAPHSGGVQDTDFVAGGSARVTPAKSTFIRLKGMAWLTRNTVPIAPIPVVPYDSLKKIVGRNTPQAIGEDRYYISEDAGQVAIFPTPSAYDSILISFYAYPAALDSTTECGFDQGWEKVVITAAAAMAYEAIGDQFWAQYYMAERDKMIAALRSMTSREAQIGSVP